MICLFFFPPLFLTVMSPILHSLSPSSSPRSFSLKKPWPATVNCRQLSLPLTHISSFSFSAPSPRSPWSSSSGLLSLRFQGEQTWGFWDLRCRFGDHRWASNRGLTISIWWWVCCIIVCAFRFCLFSPYCFCYRALWSFSNFSSHSYMTLIFYIYER